MAAMHETSRPHNAAANNPAFVEVAQVRDPDGVVAAITERSTTGEISFAIYREFEKNGETRRSAFLARRHLPALRRMIADLEDRIELEEDRSRAKRRER
jgi:hypothetical protein